MAFISFDKVYKIYPSGVKALQNISFSIEEGEFVFLVGPTGAGKTTLMKLINREELPTSGDIWFDDIRINHLDDGYLPFLRRNLGIIFQDLKLIPSRTVYENLIFPLQIMGIKKNTISKISTRILAMLEMENRKHHLVEWLSGGEMQKLCLGRALIHQPQLVLADEPTGNLDHYSAYEMVETLYLYCREEKASVIVSTHNIGLLKSFSGRILQLDQGRLVADHYNYSKVRSETGLEYR